jgi:hypothetical protein
VDIAPLLRPFCSTHDACAGSEGDSMTKRILPLALAACAVFAAAFFLRPAAAATPLAATASLGAASESAVDFVRHRRGHKAVNRRASGVEVFIIPGLYWVPAWWDANYTRACWRVIQPCKNCARNWAYTC